MPLYEAPFHCQSQLPCICTAARAHRSLPARYTVITPERFSLWYLAISCRGGTGRAVALRMLYTALL